MSLIHELRLVSWRRCGRRLCLRITYKVCGVFWKYKKNKRGKKKKERKAGPGFSPSLPLSLSLSLFLSPSVGFSLSLQSYLGRSSPISLYPTLSFSLCPLLSLYRK